MLLCCHSKIRCIPKNQKDNGCQRLLRYAEGKGVLVIVPVWELSRDLAKQTFFPESLDGWQQRID